MSSLGYSGNQWTLKTIETAYGYYPQLTAFAQNNNSSIAAASLASVSINITNGIGTSDLPFLIRSAVDIEALKVKINKGNTFQGFYFKMELNGGAKTINLGDFVPIGSSSYPFYGSFDGNNVEFTLAIDKSSANCIGLFGYFGVGTIKNLSVTGSVKGAAHTGGVVGYMASGTVTNVYNNANITGSERVGGIVGYQYNGTVSYAYNTGRIDGSSSFAGGIVGRITYGTITRIYNTAEITANAYAGGLVGYTEGANRQSYSTISYGYSFGTVSANSANVGGVIGSSSYLNTSYDYNGRSYLYYDTSVMVNYTPTKTYKPTAAMYGYNDGTYVRGLYGSLMLGQSLANSYGFTATDWTFIESTDDTAYYPQLNVFSGSALGRISTASENSVIVDISMGLGTSDYPFLIKSAFDMTELSRRVAEGNTFSSYYFKVAKA
jgi:hypothetical protein